MPTLLEGRIDAVAALGRQDRDAMFALMRRHYARVRRAAFDADLDEKQWVIRLVNPAEGTLCGFSTQRLISAPVEGRPVAALFSGDTIVDRQHWGDSALAIAWGRLAFQVMNEHPVQPLYWFLISQGYKTYRFLPVFFREFYPRFGAPTPAWARTALDTLAGRRFGDAYDSETGVVRASPGSYRLREGVAEVTPGRLRDPHVRYFVARNPGHARGDELCCLAPLTPENFSPAARRLIASSRFAQPQA